MEYNRRTDIIQRILNRVKVEYHGYTINGKPDACHIWQGPTSGTGRGGGYGRMSLNGITVAVHIVMFTCFFGYIPPKKQVDHKCNIRLCCNPDHLEMVTHLKNQKRRASRAKQKIICSKV